MLPKETKAERERKFQEQYARNIAEAERMSWPLKFLIVALVLGGGAFVAVHFFRHQLASAFPDLISDLPPPAETGSGESGGGGINGGGSSGGIKLAALTDTVSDGAIGDQLLKDDLILSVVDTKTVELNDRGVAIVIVSAIIGNGGKKPINCPAVQGVMYDTDDRQYAALQKEGQYSAGQSLNPLLCLDQRWAFVVPEGVTFKRFELTLPSHNIMTVDLTRRTPENQARQAHIVTAERERLRSAQDAFATRIADSEDRRNREEKGKTDALNAVLIKTSASRTDMAAKLDAAMQKKDQSEKNIQKLQKRIKSLENLVSTGQSAFDKCDAALKKAKQDLDVVRQEYNRSNAHDQMRLQGALVRAQEQVDLQDKRATDATTELTERKVKLKDATLELTQETRTVTTATTEITQLNTELDKLDGVLKENQKKLDELQPKGAPAPELTPEITDKGGAKALPTPPPPPPDPGEGEQK